MSEQSFPQIDVTSAGIDYAVTPAEIDLLEQLLADLLIDMTYLSEDTEA